MAERTFKIGKEVMPLLLLVLGVVFVLASFLPLSGLSKRHWTIADSRDFGQVTRELHAATIEQPESMARTPEELARYHKNLNKEFQKLNKKLEQAQNEPQRWSQILLWTGATLAAVGGLLHVVKGGD